jgi:hypothetical protein
MNNASSCLAGSPDPHPTWPMRHSTVSRVSISLVPVRLWLRFGASGGHRETRVDWPRSKPFGCQLMMTDTSRGETGPSIARRSHRSLLRHALVLPGDLADQSSGLAAERAPKVTRLGFAVAGPPGRRKSTSAGRPISDAPVRPVPADLPRGRTLAARTAAVRVPPIREADR